MSNSIPNGQSNGVHPNGEPPVVRFQISAPEVPADEGSSSQLNATFNPPHQPPLADFVAQLDEYTPTIPDAVTKFYLSTAGFETTDPRVLRLVSLAAQKYISDIANDALQHCKMRGGAVQTSKNKSKDKKFVLTTDDLSLALAEQGITLKKPMYYM